MGDASKHMGGIPNIWGHPNMWEVSKHTHYIYIHIYIYIERERERERREREIRLFILEC